MNMDMMQKFMQFRQNYQGDPKAQIQQMLNNGQISQQQYNQAVQIAQQIQSMMGKRG